jgi:hypothetical protein
VQPNKLETLDELLAQAEHYAGFCMRNSGKMSPTLFLIGADGPLMFVPASLVDADEKDAFATTARLVCIAHAATVSVMALEAWMKTATPGEKMDMTEPPSEAFDRQEVIVLMGESHSGQKQKFLPIIRHAMESFSISAKPQFPAWTRWKAVSRKFSRRKWPTTKCGCLQKQC